MQSHAELLSFYSQDQKRVEKVSKRMNAILEVKESVALLSQLLQGYSTDSCSQSHRELIKVSTTAHSGQLRKLGRRAAGS